MAYDYSALLGKIVQKFHTQYNFAHAIGLSERTVSLKLNCKIPWKQNEIVKACQVLGIDDNDIPAYFFARKAQRD